MVDRIGQQLGTYRIIRPIGHGGFADVYLGEHIYLQTQVAIKLLQMRLAEEEMEGFLIEARTIAHLVHPHIVRVLDFGIEDRTPFLVMDYASNGTLRQLHPKGKRLPLDTVVDYTKQTAEALQYAHEKKVIHRDIKPENILVGRRNDLLVSDFGIALIAQSSLHQSTQNMAGTISYMAPEQIQGRPRPASDQYALGIVVYEWLSGECPFRGTFQEIAVQHATTPPPSLREKVPLISPTVEQVVLTALAKEPKERFTSIESFAIALEQASYAPQSAIVGSLPTEPTAPSTPQPVQLPDLNVLYKESVKARSQGDLEQTAMLWQQILDRDPQFQFGTLALQMNKLLEELVQWRVKHLRSQAEQAHTSGAWVQEIGALQALLKLEPNDNEARARIAVAEKHQKYAWMYEIASQFVQEKALLEAKTQLEMLSQEDPEYGDPAKLAEKLGVLLHDPSISLPNEVHARAADALAKGREMYNRTKDELTESYLRAKRGQ